MYYFGDGLILGLMFRIKLSQSVNQSVIITTIRLFVGAPKVVVSTFDFALVLEGV